MGLGSCSVFWTILLICGAEFTWQDLAHYDSPQRKLTHSRRQADDTSCTYLSRCVFPFTYDGISYSECTSVDNLGEYWCSHDAEFNGDWSYCRCPGVYEESVSPSCTSSEACVSPFEYDGSIYTGCTTVANSGIYWCSHNENFVSGQWSECLCSTTLPDELPENPCNTSEECQFPFEYQGITYLTCTTVDHYGEYWCSHDTDYNGIWSDCDCPNTHGDSSCTYVPSECEFPFTYQGVNYTSCTSENWHSYWCAHTSLYTDDEWSECDCS